MCYQKDIQDWRAPGRWICCLLQIVLSSESESHYIVPWFLVRRPHSAECLPRRIRSWSLTPDVLWNDNIIALDKEKPLRHNDSLASFKERKVLWIGSGMLNLSFNVSQVAWPVICKKIFQHQMSWERELAAEDWDRRNAVMAGCKRKLPKKERNLPKKTTKLKSKKKTTKENLHFKQTGQVHGWQDGSSRINSSRLREEIERM